MRQAQVAMADSPAGRIYQTPDNQNSSSTSTIRSYHSDKTKAGIRHFRSDGLCDRRVPQQAAQLVGLNRTLLRSVRCYGLDNHFPRCKIR